MPGDPDSQIVHVNKVGTFGLPPASYWWTRIAAPTTCWAFSWSYSCMPTTSSHWG